MSQDYPPVLAQHTLVPHIQLQKLSQIEQVASQQVQCSECCFQQLPEQLRPTAREIQKAVKNSSASSIASKQGHISSSEKLRTRGGGEGKSTHQTKILLQVRFHFHHEQEVPFPGSCSSSALQITLPSLRQANFLSSQECSQACLKC